HFWRCCCHPGLFPSERHETSPVPCWVPPQTSSTTNTECRWVRWCSRDQFPSVSAYASSVVGTPVGTVHARRSSTAAQRRANSVTLDLRSRGSAYARL